MKKNKKLRVIVIKTAVIVRAEKNYPEIIDVDTQKKDRS